MSQRVLVLNVQVSGINTYLFSQLKNCGWRLSIENVPFPKRLRWWAYMVSFSFKGKEWRKKIEYTLNKLQLSSWCFNWRSKWCEKILRKREGTFDAVLQISSMFQINFKKGQRPPYAVLIDYTTFLALKWDAWAPLENEIDKWISLEKQVYENAKVIFTPSLNTSRSLETDYGIAQEKIVKTGYGINFEDIINVKKEYDGKTILFVGIDFERKGGYVLLEAFKRVRQAIKDARLVIIGPSKSKYGIEQAGVQFLGPINDRNVVRDHFKQASIFVMPSFCEPFGLVFLEAMAYKLPCIGSDIDAIPEIIDNGITGNIVDPGNEEELSQKIINFLEDKKKMETMGMSSFNKVKDTYKWNKIGKDIDRHLKRILKEG